MTTHLDHLRRQARRLRKAFDAGDAEALARVARVFPDRTALRHADALHVLAREEGDPSWPRLKFRLETEAASRADRVERLKVALYYGQSWRVDALLAADPTLADANLGLSIALYRLEAVRAAIEADPGAATRPVGPRRPILHLAFSKYIHQAPELEADMLAIAELLVTHGADVDDSYASAPDEEHRLSALYGALGHADNMALARWLLERGANPDDDESLYHATELGHHDGMRLLLEHGAETRGTNALARMLDFDDLNGVRLLLEHGADPNETVPDHPSGEPVPRIPALAQAARRGRDGRFADLLLAHGADPALRFDGHSPYALARIYGNRSFAEALDAAGHASDLTDVEAALARAADGEDPGEGVLAGAELSGEVRRLLSRLAGSPGALAHMKALVRAGLDPEAVDEMALPPLHVALWEGLPEHVAWLLTLDLDLARENAYGGDALGTLVHGAEFCPKREERDHLACARLLRDAGAPFRAEEARATGSEEMAEFLASWGENREEPPR